MRRERSNGGSGDDRRGRALSTARPGTGDRLRRAFLVAAILATTATVAAGATASAAPVPSTARFVALPPARILDTRTGTGQPAAGIVPAGGTISLPVAGHGGVPPTGAVAVVMNVTVTSAGAPGFVTVWPSGASRPLASSVNVDHAGQTRSNLVTVALGADGAVELFTLSSAHLVADVAGYFEPSGATSTGRVQSTPPTRVLDTRAGVGAGRAPLAGGGTLALALGGHVPADASAVILNVTATNATAPGFVTVWPAGGGLPLASNLNVEAPGQTLANLVMVPLGAGQSVDLFTLTTLDLVADLEGYVTGAASPVSTEGLFTPLAPTRVLDTRSGPAPITTGDHTMAVPLAGRYGVPATGAAAVLLNVTATDVQAPGFVTVYPDGTAIPLASNLNVERSGQTLANLAIGQLNADGRVGLYTYAGLQLVADVAGWFSGTPVTTTTPPPGPSPLPPNSDLAHSFRVVYALPSDAAADAAIVPGITHELGFVGDWFASQTGGRRPRFYAPGGVLAVDTVHLAVTTAQIEQAGDPLGTLDSALHAVGYGVSGETVVAYVPTTGNGCGSTIQHDGAATTVGIWMPACAIYPSATTVSWPYGATYLVAHEMTHAFGAVPACAPHSDGTGHVNDDNRDVLYNGANGRDWDHLMLDPGHDDYYGHAIPGCLDIAGSPFWI